MLRATLTGYVETELAVPAGQAVAVVGPNGAGKTTMLRCLAGLPSPGRALLEIEGRDVSRQPPHRRGVGYVPQDGGLFAHLSSLDNVAYGPRARGVRRSRARAAARTWLERLDISDLAHHRPAQLSGGQAGRVALARALAVDPRLLLLDEPLAALDAATRADVRRGLGVHLRSFAGVCLIVTHDPVDALALADRIVVLESGRVSQDGPPAAVTRAPRSAWVARMLGRNAYRGTTTGSGIVLDGAPGTVAGAAPDGAAASGFGGAPDTGPGLAGDARTLIVADPLPPGQEALATVHPEDVALYRKRPEGSPRNAWTGTVAEVAPTGSRVRVSVSGLDGPDIVAEITPPSVTDLALAEGAEVWASVKATEVALTPL